MGTSYDGATNNEGGLYEAMHRGPVLLWTP
jgi:hypothetical protein